MNNALCEMPRVEFPFFAFLHDRSVFGAQSKAGGSGVSGGAATAAGAWKVEFGGIDARIGATPHGGSLAIPDNMAGPAAQDETRSSRTVPFPPEYRALIHPPRDRRRLGPGTRVACEQRSGATTVRAGTIGAMEAAS